MRHLLALLLGLVILWLGLSGHYSPLLLGLGAVSCLFTAWICARLGLVNGEAVPLAILPRLPGYALWLLVQILRSSVEVAARLLGPRRFMRASVIERALDQRSDLGRAIFANSVTLTPGTAVIGLEGGRAMIHSLTPLSEGDITESAMNRRVRRLEGGD